LLLPLALAACGPAKSSDENLDSLDAELTNTADANQPGKDPALMSALQSQIMVDPALAQQSNADAARPADQPYAAPVPAEGIAAPNPNLPQPPAGPLMKTPAPRADCPQCDVAKQSVTLGGLAARQKAPGVAACVGGMRYSANWATRMPADVPLYPQARLIEAAGNAAGNCGLRAATFTTDADVQQVLDWYYTRTTSAGFESEHQADGDEHVLGGNRERDQAAFILFATSRSGGGTQVDLIVNNGI
jgi:hypothetical protein